MDKPLQYLRFISVARVFWSSLANRFFVSSLLGSAPCFITHLEQVLINDAFLPIMHSRSYTSSFFWGNCKTQAALSGQTGKVQIGSSTERTEDSKYQKPICVFFSFLLSLYMMHRRYLQVKLVLLFQVSTILISLLPTMLENLGVEEQRIQAQAWVDVLSNIRWHLSKVHKHILYTLFNSTLWDKFHQESHFLNKFKQFMGFKIQG